MHGMTRSKRSASIRRLGYRLRDPTPGPTPEHPDSQLLLNVPRFAPVWDRLLPPAYLTDDFSSLPGPNLTLGHKWEDASSLWMIVYQASALASFEKMVVSGVVVTKALVWRRVWEAFHW